MATSKLGHLAIINSRLLTLLDSDQISIDCANEQARADIVDTLDQLTLVMQDINATGALCGADARLEALAAFAQRCLSLDEAYSISADLRDAARKALGLQPAAQHNHQPT